VSSHPTLNHQQGSDPVIRAWTDLKDTEWACRLGQATDQQLHHARQAWQPHAAIPGRWAQPTIAELRDHGDHDQADRISDLQRRTQAQRAHQARQHVEQAFDRLNPDFAVPADTRDPTGHHPVQQREAGLALGTRTAVAITRETSPTPSSASPARTTASPPSSASPATPTPGRAWSRPHPSAKRPRHRPGTRRRWPRSRPTSPPLDPHRPRSTQGAA
jgi:hypothetical protein